MIPALDSFKARHALRSAIRAFFDKRDYVEVDTPIGVQLPGTEVHLGYFRTSWRDFAGKGRDLFLRSSPELHLKKVMALGASRVYELAKCFRNDGEVSDWHHPEFTMLEWYEAGVSFDAFVDLTEALLRETAAQFKESKLVLPKKIERIPVAEAFERFAGLKLNDLDPELGIKAHKVGSPSVRPDDDFETAFFKVLMDKVEPGLAQLGAAVLVDYPSSQAALATVRGGVAKRFEFYVGRVELCNGFEELVDETANRDRIRHALRRRKELGHEVPDEDLSFYAALRSGLPPCCGNALGFDRWLALLLGEPGIAGVIPFRGGAPYGG